MPIRASSATYFLTRFAFAFGTCIFINDNVIETTFITGQSMSPTLSPNHHATGAEDLVLWKKWKPTRNLQRGDVVHFANPTRPEALMVKRVIGLEGDTVVLDKRRRPRRREGPDPPEARAWDAWQGRAEVPPGHVWVEGDNAGESRDSNDYGPISRSLISGKAVSVVWPPSRFLTTPWLAYRSRTKVIAGSRVRDWTEGLPVELAEINAPHMPPIRLEKK